MQKILITLALLALGGCAHKIEIQQGNVITQDQLAQLHNGMERRQVRALLGSPLLTDPFHPERWDYYYSLSQGDVVKKRYHLTLIFSEERLQRFESTGTFPRDEYQDMERKEKADNQSAVDEFL